MRITDFPMLFDIKKEYRNYREEGMGRSEAVNALMKDYHDELELGADDDGLLFWVALADAQYACRELSEEIAQKGLEAVEAISGTDWEITPGDLQRRRERYRTSQMPERASIKKPKRFRCRWQVGDTFAYKLSGPEVEACGIDGRYVLIRKVDEKEFLEGSTEPVVTFTLWDSEKLPENAQEFQRLPILKLENGRLGTPKTHFEYRALLIISSARKLNKLQNQLKYLGNFKDIPMPENELIIDYPGYMYLISPERIDIGCTYFWKKLQQFPKDQSCKEGPIFIDVAPPRF